MAGSDRKGRVFRIKRFSIHDGPGIRTAVFLKGCPLKCAWCHSPEGISHNIVTWHNSNTCISCGSCVRSCPAAALKLAPGNRVEIDRTLCSNERVCVKVCPTGSMQPDGFMTSPENILDEVLRDVAWYEASGGGVTLTGGEPLFQPAFATEILRRCRQNGIHTAIETSLHAPWSDIAAAAKHLDLVIADLKIADRVKHRLYTGVSNDLVRQNFIRLAAERIPMVVRIPLVPGITDSEENIASIRSFVSEIDAQMPVELITFNPLARNNYDRLGIPYFL